MENIKVEGDNTKLGDFERTLLIQDIKRGVLKSFKSINPRMHDVFSDIEKKTKYSNFNRAKLIVESHLESIKMASKIDKTSEAPKTDKNSEAPKTDKSSEAPKIDENSVAPETEKNFKAPKIDGSSEAPKTVKKSKARKIEHLPTKEFVIRDSPLTDMYNDKHIRTIYNLCVSTLIILMIHTAVSDIKRTGSPNLGINTIRAGFGKFWIVFYVWPVMKTSTFLVYAFFALWASHRQRFSPKSIGVQIWDSIWLIFFGVYEGLLFIFPAMIVLENEMPLASSMIILMEQVRLVMKTYAFIRSVAPRFLSYKPHSDKTEPVLPRFPQYLYFLFAPTLIFQDTYPRLKNVRWNVVLVNIVEIATIIVFLALLYERMLYPNFKDFGKEPIGWETLILNMLSSMLPGILLYLCGFYLFLHSWMNVFAELLQFGDRLFYKDWWNSNGYSAYYRTWNVIVHDFLYTYIYKDLYEITHNRAGSMIIVFFISAVIHEYIICCSIGFFYPLLFYLFGGVGVFMNFVFRSAGNVFMWLTLSAGSGILVSMYCMEYFARIHCPATGDDFFHFMVPRTIECF